MSIPDVIAVVDEGLGNSSYVVDLGDGRALVVDPVRHPRGYLDKARCRGLEVAYAVETHLHADFVSGARELSALGTQVMAPADALHRYAVQGLRDGDERDLGPLRLRALATPGHTPEHLSYLLFDGRRPVALFSGGSLLVGAVARTDLIDAAMTERLARDLWRSLQERVMVLPDDLPVFPTHGAGSFCSAPAGAERITTIGREKASNPLLAATDESAFVERLMAGLGSYPPYFLRLRDVNRNPRLHGPGAPVLPEVSPDDVRRLQRGGAWVVDARPIAAFAAGHVPGSVSIALRPQFATWLGWIVPPGAPLVFVLDADQDRAEIVRQARAVGYDDVMGELVGGMECWVAAGGEAATTPLAPVADAHDPVVDVRQRSEYRAGHIPGSVSAELGDLEPSTLPAGPITVMCGHGERAMTAATVLARAGRHDVTVLIGGPDEWSARHGRLDHA